MLNIRFVLLLWTLSDFLVYYLSIQTYPHKPFTHISHPSAAHPSSLTLPHRYISQHNYDAGVNDSRILFTIRRNRILPHPTSLTNTSYLNVVVWHYTERDTISTWFESVCSKYRRTPVVFTYSLHRRWGVVEQRQCNSFYTLISLTVY